MITGQQLIDTFFDDLSRMQLDRCSEHLQQLETLANHDLTLQDWCLYLKGILSNERDRNWVNSERIFRTLLDRELDPDLQGRVLIALGRTHDYQGHWREALKVYEQCLTTFDGPDQVVDRAIIWRNMAISIEKGFLLQVFDQTELMQGVQYCKNALSVLQSIRTADSPEKVTWNIAATWNTLGVIYRDLVDWTQAASCYEQFIALAHQLNSAYNIGMGHNNLGEVFQQQGPEKWPEAQQAYEKALEIYQAFGDVYEQVDVLSNLGSLHRDMAKLDAALTYYEQAITIAESIRARLTAPAAQADYRATIEAIYAAPVSIHLQKGDAAQAFTAAERARCRVLADLLAGQSAQPHADLPAPLLEQRTTLRQLLDQAYAADPTPDNLPGLEAALADLDRQIELLDPNYAALETMTALTAAEVQAYLGPQSALLAYTGDANDGLWALVVTANDVQATPIAGVSVSWLHDFLASHLDGKRGGLLPNPETGHLAPPRLFPMLFQALITPVQAQLGGRQTIYIIPFGPLHYLPLGALTLTHQDPPPLLAAGQRVVYAPSATVLFTYCHSRPPSPYSGLLALAPPDEQLRFTAGAAQAITPQSSDQALIDAQATRRNLLTQAGQYRVLCFLGHALFDENYPMSSRLKLADGSLHASEILRDLRLQADLVILSACETGRSHILRGDEIMGLSRAMLYAGTPSLLVTLWPVHEIPTRLVVEHFVAQLAADEPVEAGLALAATQRWLRAISFAEAQHILTTWPELSPADATAHLTQLWHLTHPNQPPTPTDQIFAHPFFWSPYILVGSK